MIIYYRKFVGSNENNDIILSLLYCNYNTKVYIYLLKPLFMVKSQNRTDYQTNNNYQPLKVDEIKGSLKEVTWNWYKKFELEGHGYKAETSKSIDGAIEFSLKNNQKSIGLVAFLDDDSDTDSVIKQIKESADNGVVIKAGAKIFQLHENTENVGYKAPQVYRKLHFSNHTRKDFGVKADYLEIGNNRYICQKRNIKKD